MNWFKKLDLAIGMWLARKLGLTFGVGGGVMHAHTKLTARLIVDGKYTDVRRVVRDKVVTTAFVDYIVDQLQAEDSEFGDFKYHDSGIGVGAENITDVGLGTPTRENEENKER